MFVFGKDGITKLKEYFQSKSLASELCPFSSQTTCMQRERLDFDPDEMFSKMKKTQKCSDQNIWKLPLLTISSEKELLSSMTSFHEKAHDMEKTMGDDDVLDQDELEVGFAEKACTALSKHWMNQELLRITLSNVMMIADKASCPLKRSLVDEKVVLASALAVSLLREHHLSSHTSQDDDCAEIVLVMLCCITKEHNCEFDRFNSELIKPFLLAAPSIADCAKRKGRGLEQFSYLMRKLLTVIDDQNRRVVNRYLSKYSILSFAIDYIATNNTFGASEATDRIIIKFVDTTFLLREEAETKDLLSVVPTLLSVVTLINSSSLDHICSCCTTETFPAALGILTHIIEHISGDCAERLMSRDFFSKILNAITINRAKEVDVMQLTKVLCRAMVKFRLLALDDCQISDEVYYSTMRHLCSEIQGKFVSSNDLRICYSYLFYYATCFSHQDEQSMLRLTDEETIIVTMKVLTVIYYTDDTEKRKFASVFDQDNGDPAACFARYVFEFISHVAYKGSQDMVNKLAKIVNDNLPQIVEQFGGKGDELRGVKFMYSDIVTRLVLISLDEIDNFFSDQWKDVRSLMLERGYFKGLIISRRRVYSTSLLFMWRLVNMEQREPFVSSLLQLEDACRTSDYNESKMEKFFDQFYENLYSTQSIFDSEKIEKSSKKHFEYLMADLKLILSNSEKFTIFIFDDNVSELHKITRLMVKIAQNIQDKWQRNQLRDLVWWALDLVRHYKDDEIVKANVNDFIIYVYLKDYD